MSRLPQDPAATHPGSYCPQPQHLEAFHPELVSPASFGWVSTFAPRSACACTAETAAGSDSVLAGQEPPAYCRVILPGRAVFTGFFVDRGRQMPETYTMEFKARPPVQSAADEREWLTLQQTTAAQYGLADAGDHIIDVFGHGCSPTGYFTFGGRLDVCTCAHEAAR